MNEICLDCRRQFGPNLTNHLLTEQNCILSSQWHGIIFEAILDKSFTNRILLRPEFTSVTQIRETFLSNLRNKTKWLNRVEERLPLFARIVIKLEIELIITLTGDAHNINKRVTQSEFFKIKSLNGLTHLQTHPPIDYETFSPVISQGEQGNIYLFQYEGWTSFPRGRLELSTVLYNEIIIDCVLETITFNNNWSIKNISIPHTDTCMVSRKAKEYNKKYLKFSSLS